MKKQYIEPTVLVVNVKIENLMLEASGETNTGEAQSRQSSNWEDE